MPIKKKNVRSPTEIDDLIGKNLCAIRLLKGYTQEGLAAELGITFQQVQKNEKGINRLAASRLFEISRILKAPLEDFFKGHPDFPKTVGESLLTEENIKILKAIEDLPSLEKKELAFKLLSALK